MSQNVSILKDNNTIHISGTLNVSKTFDHAIYRLTAMHLLTVLAYQSAVITDIGYANSVTARTCGLAKLCYWSAYGICDRCTMRLVCKQHLTPLLRSSLQLHLLLLLLTVTQVRYSYGELSCWNELHCCEVSAWFTVVNNGRCASLAIIHV